MTPEPDGRLPVATATTDPDGNVRLTYPDGTPVGPDGGLVLCPECGEPPSVCPDMCGTRFETTPSGPPPARRRPFPIGLDGRVVK